MSVYKKSSVRNLGAAKPVVLGTVLAIVVTALLCGVFSLIFVIINSIAESAIMPAAMLSACAGCLIGAYICARMCGSRGLIFGAAVGCAVFVVVWLFGLCSGNSGFGAYWLVKLLTLSICGCIGGYLGSNSRRRRRKS